MKALLKTLTAIAVTAILGCTAAQAVTVDFLYQVPGDGSGKTSRLINPDNTVNPFSGYFIETFDKKGNQDAAPKGVDFLNGDCGFNTLGSAGTLTVDGGGFALTKGSVGSVNAAPAGDSTCYVYGPKPSGGLKATAKIDYTADLAGSGAKISYLGLYYGSIDDYNDLAFYDENGLMTGGGGLLDDGYLTGTEILAYMGGSAGNQLDDKSNVYVNIFFDLDEAFTAFEMITDGRAVEIDNIVTGLTSRGQDVPEPGSLALLGLGLAGLAAARRRKAA